ncbi:GlxA family transcriptional regulator [Herbaspirillum sp. GCM10030257]|uniref:GlxA family transcriptional regulator n=1 Tax=Herbaspirillum sp. GCM10030257 TaxID=3273393 RepID=UPI00361C4C06
MTSSSNIVDIGVLVYPCCLRSSAVVPLDVFRIANTLALYRPASQRVHFRGRWLSAREENIVAIDGLTFQTESLATAKPDALMLPGIDHGTLHDLVPLLKQLKPESDAVQAFSQSGQLLAASCSSACLLAHAGLLDGRRATTSWWLAAYFRQQFPLVTLDAEELIVQDGPFVTSGGVTSSLDLALWLVGHFGGAELRQMTAKILVMDGNRASQAPYVASAMIQDAGHAVIERARRWLNKRLDQTWTVAELSTYCNTSSRTLLRRFQEATGMSPIQYSQQLRVERAKGLLESTRLSLAEITDQCGYADVATFSKTFKRWTQLTPREYRVRFGLRH